MKSNDIMLAGVTLNVIFDIFSDKFYNQVFKAQNVLGLLKQAIEPLKMRIQL